MQLSDMTPIAHEHLKRELIKEVPFVGKILEAMTFGVVDDANKKADKEKLYTILNAASTDLGDILEKLREQRELSRQMQEAISTLTRYIEAVPTTRDIITVESAAVHEPGLLPANVDSVAHYLPPTPMGRFQLDQLLLGMVEAQIDQVIGDIPNAKNFVRMNVAKSPKIQDLLDWAEADDGPTLAGLYAYIQRRKATLHHPLSSVIDASLTKSVRFELVLDADFKDFDQAQLDSVFERIRSLTNDSTIRMLGTKEGSVKIELAGKEEAFRVLRNLFATGQLTELCGLKIKDIAFLNMPEPEQKRIFISFAKEDDAVVEELKLTLEPLRRQNDVDVWTFHDIPVGSEWDREIKEALGSASIVFLILSRKFLASRYIHENELPEILRRAEEGSVRPLTIFASFVPKNPIADIRRYQALNDPNQPLNEMTDAEKEHFWAKVYEAIENPH